MGREALVTHEQVADAADALTKAGAKPTSRAIQQFMDQELARARAVFEGELAHQQQETSDPAIENARLSSTIAEQAEQLDSLAAEKAAAQGRNAQLEADLEAAGKDAERKR